MNAEEDQHTRPRGVYWLPNLLTTAALFSGFYAIVAAIDLKFENAGIAVLVAMLFDGLDGRVARWTHTESAFGKEYDSLSDMVSFGLAPAIVTYQWGVARIAEYGPLWRRLGWLVCFFYAAAAALRLARSMHVLPLRTSSISRGCPAHRRPRSSPPWCGSRATRPTSACRLDSRVPRHRVRGALMISRFAFNSFKGVTPGARVRFRTSSWCAGVRADRVAPVHHAARAVRRLCPVGAHRMDLPQAAQAVARDSRAAGVAP